MASRSYIVATAGHVDHGKSALVHALTGTDPDRLPEEKARGITIDLGFAHLRLPAPRAAGEMYDLGLVDVPGHEDFIQNMVSGVSAVDLALLVVAADDLWMPQTEEHLQILAYLGVRHAVVALTKIDLAAADEELAIRAVRERLRDSVFAVAPIVPTSIPKGRGIEELKAALAAVLAVTPAPRDIGKPRLPVDRVFTLRGIGTVVTGTLSGGALRKGDRLVAQPSGSSAQIRSVQNHHLAVEAAQPGTRAALNLPDLGAGNGGSGNSGGAVRRGDVLALPDAGQPSAVLDVWLERTARGRASSREPSPALKTGRQVRLHLGSGHWNARLTLLDTRQLAPGERAIARLRVESPIFAFAGDRFILRDGSERLTLAGGIVLDPDARRSLRRPAQREFLLSVAADPSDCERALSATVRRDGAVRRSELLAKANFSREEIAAAVERLLLTCALLAAGEFIVWSERWGVVCAGAAEKVDAWHRAHPEKMGLSFADLRTQMTPALPAAELFEPLLAALRQNGFGAIRRVDPAGRASTGASAAVPPGRRPHPGGLEGATARTTFGQGTGARYRGPASAALPARYG